MARKINFFAGSEGNWDWLKKDKDGKQEQSLVERVEPVKIPDHSLKIFTVEFDPMWPLEGCLWPVEGCLVIAAHDVDEATIIAEQTVTHTKVRSVNEIILDKEQVIVYLSGDY